MNHPGNTFAEILRQIFRLPSTFVLLAFSLFSLTLSIARYLYSDSIFFIFLVWNLFLAFVPWMVAVLIHVTDLRRRFPVVLLIMFWMLFFPNSPYILTDLVHLGKNSAAPLWFDIILILSYAFCGLYYGFVSLNLIELALKRAFALRRPLFISLGMIFLSAFGIYIGRFLRWNSWDALLRPARIIDDTWSIFAKPLENRSAWGFSLLMGTFLVLMYLAFKNFQVSRDTDPR